MTSEARSPPIKSLSSKSKVAVSANIIFHHTCTPSERKDALVAISIYSLCWNVQVPNLADLKSVYPSQGGGTESGSSSARSSVMGDTDMPVGSRWNIAAAAVKLLSMLMVHVIVWQKLYRVLTCAHSTLNRFGVTRNNMPTAESLGLPSLSNGHSEALPDLSAPLPQLTDTSKAIYISILLYSVECNDIVVANIAGYCACSAGNKYLKKKGSVSDVPDLDELSGDGLVNGTKELVYDMDQLGL